jgi:hypothetical protein
VKNDKANHVFDVLLTVHHSSTIYITNLIHTSLSLSLLSGFKVKKLGCEVDHFSPCSTEFENECSFTSVTLYGSTACAGLWILFYHPAHKWYISKVLVEVEV